MPTEVNVTHLRQHLQDYLQRAQAGEEILIKSRGRVVARLLPGADPRDEAERHILKLRANCFVGDVVSPIDADWDVLRADS